MSGFVVAIDGPAASGKSTTARLVARELGFLYLDTGAMYRAVTWKALDAGLDVHGADAPARLKALVRDFDLSLEAEDGGARVRVDGVDVTDRIRAPEISRNVSIVSRVPAVRRRMVEIQRELGRTGSCVMEGRDIGTVVFPDARVKIFLKASLEERVERRLRELERTGVTQGREELIREIERRDRLDSEREDSPLRPADDAIPLDTTGLTIEGQVAEVLRVVREEMARPDPDPAP